jgi:KipI family sensor histidine kinase inhibitor
MLGFMLGFPYMGIVDPLIQIPRKANPRKEVAAGSIGIAGNQTGIYPSNAPGGWQIIGRTPIEIFDINAAFPFAIEAGDYIQFNAVSIDEYYKIKAAHKAGDYQIEYEK